MAKKQDPKRNLRAASDSLTQANINNPWIQRFLQGNALSIPDPYNTGSGKTSTHGLSYHPLDNNNAMLYPEIIQKGDSLVKLDNDAAREYAIKNKTGIITDLELAKYYSENGLIDHEKFAKGGTVMAKKQNIEQFGNGGFLDKMFHPFQVPEGQQLNEKGINRLTGMQNSINTVGNILGHVPLIGGIAKAQTNWASGKIQGMLDGSAQNAMVEEDPMNNMFNMAPQSQMVSNQYAPTFSKGGKVKMPLGGVVESKLVELEDGEPFRSPDGKIGVIKNDKKLAHSKGGAKLPLEIGTQVLGKKKDPDTKMKFKELGAKLAKSKQKYDKILEENKGTYSRNAAKAMNRKIDDQFTTLFQKQESLKGTKNQKFAQGGQIEPWMTDLSDWGNTMDGGQIPEVGVYGQGTSTLPYGGFQPTPQGPSADPTINYAGAGVPGNYGMGSGAGLSDGTEGGWRNFNWGNALNTAAQLAPIGYNLIQGMRPADHQNAQDFYNPQYGQSIDLMSNRRTNIQPMLDANRSAQATGDYNVRTALGGMGAGAVASNQLANRAQRMRGDQSAHAFKQNQDLKYKGQEAQMRARLGGQRAQTNYQISTDNLAADAARRNMLGTGFSQMSQYAQMQQLMKGQQGQDQQRLQIMEQMYPYFKDLFGKVNFG